MFNAPHDPRSTLLFGICQVFHLWSQARHQHLCGRKGIMISPSPKLTKIMISIAQPISRSHIVWFDPQWGQLNLPAGPRGCGLCSGRGGVEGREAAREEQQCLHLMASNRISSAQKGHFFAVGSGGGETAVSWSRAAVFGALLGTQTCFLQLGQQRTSPAMSDGASSDSPQCSQAKRMSFAGFSLFIVSCWKLQWRGRSFHHVFFFLVFREVHTKWIWYQAFFKAGC